jgi:hypothetical protein
MSFLATQKFLRLRFTKHQITIIHKPYILWIKLHKIKSIDRKTFEEIFSIVPSLDFTFFSDEDIKKEINSLKSKNTRIKVDSDIILHLSDIHLGNDFGFPLTSTQGKRSLLDILITYFKNEFKQKIGLLIVSGDISSRGDGNVLINEGLKFLNDFCNAMEIKKEHVLIIPGNHDIPLKDAVFTDYNHEKPISSFS